MHTLMDLDTNRTAVQAADYRWLVGQSGQRRTVTIAGLGDVGRTVALGLVLACGDVISRIRLYDLQTAQCERMEIEIGQMRDPTGEVAIPAVEVATAENLFDTDVFLFCVARAVPPVGSGVTDVRMAQYAVNRPIVMSYAQMAGNAGYTGLFGVVSDPVDLLCAAALEAQAGTTQPLSPYQIQGFGLGVMAGRAAYYAAREPRYASFLENGQGRLYGPHGQDLVVANSADPAVYDDALSCELTERVVTANQAVRALGFKPYMAPAISSAALTLRAVLLGQWNDSAQYLGGVYLGCRNRTTPDGVERETAPLPDALYERIAAAYAHLQEQAQRETT